MGCDYYHITFLKIFFKDDSCEKFIELDREREWFIEVEGQNDMTEEEYDECQEKYGVVCQEPIIIYNNFILSEKLLSGNCSIPWFTINKAVSRLSIR